MKHHVPGNYRETLQDAAWHLSQADGGFMDERQLLQLLRAEHGAVADEIPVDRNLLVAHMVLEPTTLVRCELDRDAQSFFSDNGATLIDCTVV